MNPVMTGLMMPGMVPMVLEMPMRMAAYCGAMSRWLMEKPALGWHSVLSRDFTTEIFTPLTVL